MEKLFKNPIFWVIIGIILLLIIFRKKIFAGQNLQYGGIIPEKKGAPLYCFTPQTGTPCPLRIKRKGGWLSLNSLYSSSNLCCYS